MNHEKKAYSLWEGGGGVLFEKLEEDFRGSEKDIGAQGRSLTSLNSANRKLANRIINTSQRSCEAAPVHPMNLSLPNTVMSPSWTSTADA